MVELGNLIMADMEKIKEPGNPIREKITEEGLEELAKSMVKVGLENPIKLRSIPSGYEIVSGNRRYLAAKDLGWTQIPAIIVNVDERELRLKRIHENIHREDMSPIEEGKACRDLMQEHGYSQREVARMCAKSESWVFTRLALLEMPLELQDAVDVGALAVSAARELAAITEEDSRRYYTEWAIKQGATAQLCAFWRSRWEIEKIVHGPGDGSSGPGPLNPPPLEAMMRCFWCEKDTPIRSIEHVRVCPMCREVIVHAKLVLITEAAREEVGKRE